MIEKFVCNNITKAMNDTYWTGKIKAIANDNVLRNIPTVQEITSLKWQADVTLKRTQR